MTNYIPSITPQSFADSFAKTALLAAAPAIELQFFRTQAVIQERMDKDIAAILDASTGSTGATAHLTRRLTAIDARLAELSAYAARATDNEELVDEALDQLDELRALADPTTIAEFDAKQVEVLATLGRLRTAGVPPVGTVADRLGAARATAIAAIEAIVTNDFATAGDIAAVQAEIDTIAADLTNTLALVELNADVANNTVDSLEEIKLRTQSEIDDIELDRRGAANDKVREAQEYYSRILTSLSYAMDAALYQATQIGDRLAVSTTPTTGTVIDFVA